MCKPVQASSLIEFYVKYRNIKWLSRFKKGQICNRVSFA